MSPSPTALFLFHKEIFNHCFDTALNQSKSEFFLVGFKTRKHGESFHGESGRLMILTESFNKNQGCVRPTPNFRGFQTPTF